MQQKPNYNILKRYSIRYLFCALKYSNDCSIVSEIYSRTYDHVFNYIYPKVSSTSDASTIVRDVYGVLSTTQLINEKEQDILAYLERVADGCLVLYSRNSTKTRNYA